MIEKRSTFFTGWGFMWMNEKRGVLLLVIAGIFKNVMLIKLYGLFLPFRR